MRKLIKTYLLWSSVVWVFTIAFASFAPISLWAGIVAIVAGFIMIFMTLFIALTMTHSGLDKDWFKAQEELRKELDDTRTLLSKVKAYESVIGEHEAVKIWKSSQKKDENNEEDT